jgi:hypothetical protein
MVYGVGMKATFGHIVTRESACYCFVLFFITQVHFICLEKRRLNSNLRISFLPLNHTHTHTMDPSQDPMWEQVQKMILINGRIGILFKLFSDFFGGEEYGSGETCLFFIISFQ